MGHDIRFLERLSHFNKKTLCGFASLRLLR